jgi:hypothetical protein
MSRIFVSYRRQDSAGHTGRLYDFLAQRYGAERVFMDVATIAPGQDFVAAVEAELASCSAVVAVIGRDWLDARDDTGRRRLDNPSDFVCMELAVALARPGLMYIVVATTLVSLGLMYFIQRTVAEARR